MGVRHREEGAAIRQDLLVPRGEALVQHLGRVAVRVAASRVRPRDTGKVGVELRARARGQCGRGRRAREAEMEGKDALPEEERARVPLKVYGDLEGELEARAKG